MLAGGPARTTWGHKQSAIRWIIGDKCYVIKSNYPSDYPLMIYFPKLCNILNTIMLHIYFPQLCNKCVRKGKTLTCEGVRSFILPHVVNLHRAWFLIGCARKLFSSRFSFMSSIKHGLPENHGKPTIYIVPCFFHDFSDSPLFLIEKTIQLLQFVRGFPSSGG